jgi:hypothetical protein
MIIFSSIIPVNAGKETPNRICFYNYNLLYNYSQTYPFQIFEKLYMLPLHAYTKGQFKGIGNSITKLSLHKTSEKEDAERNTHIFIDVAKSVFESIGF